MRTLYHLVQSYWDRGEDARARDTLRELERQFGDDPRAAVLIERARQSLTRVPR